MNLSRGMKIGIAILALVAIGGLAGYFRLFSNGIPSVFTEGRMQGAIISDSIVQLSNDISGNLSKVNALDNAGNPKDALDLTIEVQGKVKEVRAKADQLSIELKNMISGLDNIKPPAARQAALDAITNQMAIISRLLSYSNYLDELSQVLTNHFREVSDARSVSLIISQINAEVTAVNSFNRQATQAMDRFDAAMKAE